MFPWRKKNRVVLLGDGTALGFRDVKTHFTKLGNGMMLVALATWLAAVNYAVSLAYALCFMMCGILIWAWFLSILQLAGMRVSVLSQSEGFVGDRMKIVLNVGSDKNRHRRILVSFVENLAPRATINLAKVDTKVKSQAELHVVAKRRGLNRLPDIILYSHSPFAMVSAQCMVNLEHDVLAFAHPIENAEVEGAPVQGSGYKKSKAGSDDVSHLGEYREGESPKIIAWKQYAKTDRLLAKQFEEETGSHSNLISYRDYPGVSNRDAVAGYMTWRVLQAEKNKLEYIVEVPSETIPTCEGQREKSLGAIALM